MKSLEKAVFPFLYSLFFVLLFVAGCKKDSDSNPVSPGPGSTQELATVSTDQILNITYDTALVVSTVSKEGKSAVLAMGVAYGKNPNPTVVSDKFVPHPSFGTGTFRITLRNLELGATYYVRSYATNAVGTAYSEQKSFSTQGATSPALTTLAVTDINLFKAFSGGKVNLQGSSPVIKRGLVWSTTPGPTLSSSGKVEAPQAGTGTFNLEMTGLQANTRYYVRAFATNSQRTGYGNEQVFTTLPKAVPTVVTMAVSTITSNFVIGRGNITDVGSSDVIEKGVVWSTNANPSLSSTGKASIPWGGLGEFSRNVTGLNPNTTYYIRAYATNGQGTGYGAVETFTTTSPPLPVTDIDGNVYQTVEIGTQVWTKENLRVTRFQNGAAIFTGLTHNQWLTTTSAAYGYYADNPAFVDRLYNWYAVVNFRKLCPAGWHVPSDEEWGILNDFLGSYAISGGKMKSLTGWTTPNVGATNESGFSGVGGGYRIGDYSYQAGISGYWWSSTPGNNSFEGWSYVLNSGNGELDRRSNSRNNGYSVRCVKD